MGPMPVPFPLGGIPFIASAKTAVLSMALRSRFEGHDHLIRHHAAASRLHRIHLCQTLSTGKPKEGMGSAIVPSKRLSHVNIKVQDFSSVEL